MVDPAFAACFGQVIVEHAQMLRQGRQGGFSPRRAAPAGKAAPSSRTKGPRRRPGRPLSESYTQRPMAPNQKRMIPLRRQ